MSNSDVTHPLSLLVKEWDAKITAALEFKNREFQNDAVEAKEFFDGSHTFMWDKAQAVGGFLDKDSTNALPPFRFQCNRVFEMVALFGPALYHTNPRIQVTPQFYPEISPEALGIVPPAAPAPGQMPAPPDPMLIQRALQYQQMAQAELIKRAEMKACAEIKQHFLNWLQQEKDKKTQARAAIEEAIQTGMSFLETRLEQSPGAQTKYPLSRYLSSDDVVFDPDANYWEDLRWIAIKRVEAKWETERKFELPEGSLPGTAKSAGAQATSASKSASERRPDEDGGKSFDLNIYWDVYTKCGIGDRLKDAQAGPVAKALGQILGDYCYLAINRDVPHPLNLPSELLVQYAQVSEQAAAQPPSFDPNQPNPLVQQAEQLQQDLFMRAQWPIPFWTDGGWPISRLHWYKRSRKVYPISLVKPGIGELRFINWAMSWLATKAAASSKVYMGIAKSAAEEFYNQASKQVGPFTLIEISELAGKRIDELVSILKGPDVDYALWQIVAAVQEQFDKRVGLNDLMYGMTGQQMRSATEADVRQSNTNIRPEDMASQVEDWLSECAMKEMEAARWFCEPQDIQPVLGQMGAMFWQQYIMTQDIDRVVRDYDYRVEAGSARKPNKMNRARQINEFAVAALPVLQTFALQAGQVEPLNALLSDMAEANDLEPGRYRLMPPPPPMPPDQPQPSGAPANASPE